MDTIELIEPNESYAEDLWAFRTEVMNRDRNEKEMFAGCKTLQLASNPQEFIDRDLQEGRNGHTFQYISCSQKRGQ